MPFNRPTLPELIDQNATEIESRLPGVLVRVRRSLVGVLNRVFSGALAALYQFVEWLFRQAWPDTADAEYLDWHGARWRVTRTPAAAANGPASFAGTNDTLVPLGTVVQRGDGVQYRTTADATVVAGAVPLSLVAVVPGQSGNASIGVALTLASPIAGLSSGGATTGALVDGADVELDEPYRARILARVRKVPQGGADYDYTDWVKEVPGVTRVWVYPKEQGAGTVTVRFMRDNDPTPIPDAGEVATVQSHLDALRPVTADVFAVAPIGVLQNYTVALTPATPAVKAAVEAELAAMILRDGQPGGILLVSHNREAISIAAGERDHVLLSPSADVVFPTGHIPVMGVVTWV